MIKIIAAVSKNGVIGNNGDLIFRNKEDMKHFRETTMGHPCIMGRVTWESLPKPLEGRTNIVVTESYKEYESKDNVIYLNLELAVECVWGQDVFIIGGGEIYKQMIDEADELIITEFHEDAEGDTFFPEIDPEVWEIKGLRGNKDFVIKTYKRKVNDN